MLKMRKAAEERKSMYQKIRNIQIHFERFRKRSQFWILGYREANLLELRKLTAIYEEHIWSKRQLSTLQTEDLEKEKTPSKALTHLLEIDWVKKEPKASEQEIYSSFTFHQPKEGGILVDDCKSIFSIIVNAIYERLESAGGYYEQINSAIILFSAELLCWLNELAKRPCEKTTLEDIQYRLRYLDAVLEKPVFEDEAATDYAIQQIVFQVTECLETIVLPKVEWQIKKKSAREYINNLKIHTESYFRTTLNALFYIYSNGEHVELFEIGMLGIRFHEQLDLMIETRLGDLFVPFKGIFDAPHSQQASSQQQLLSMNIFLDDQGNPRIEHLRSLLNRNLENKDERKVGVHSMMYDEECIRNLICQLGYLNDFKLLLTGFEKAYELAGLGGDWLLYIALCKETSNLLAAFVQVVNRSIENLEEIFQYARRMYRQCIFSAKEQLWRQHFLTFKQKLTESRLALSQCEESLFCLVTSMRSAQDVTYKEKVQEEISQFCEIVKCVTSRMITISVEEISDSDPFPISIETPVQPRSQLTNSKASDRSTLKSGGQFGSASSFFGSFAEEKKGTHNLLMDTKLLIEANQRRRLLKSGEPFNKQKGEVTDNLIFSREAKIWLSKFNFQKEGKTPVIRSDQTTLIIPLMEEDLGIETKDELLTKFGVYITEAAGKDNVTEYRVGNGRLKLVFDDVKITQAVIKLLKEEGFSIQQQDRNSPMHPTQSM